MQEVISWKAEDGTIFRDSDECILYEILCVTGGKMSDEFSFKDNEGKEIDLIQVVEDMQDIDPHDSRKILHALNYVWNITLNDDRDVECMNMLKAYWEILLPNEIGEWYWDNAKSKWIKEEGIDENN